MMKRHLVEAGTVPSICFFVNQSHLILRSVLREQSMRSTVLIIVLGTALAACASTAVVAQPITGPATGVRSAPIGHLQPRPQQFSRDSAAEQTQQWEMSNFDAEQQRLDQERDAHLNICRGC
jgi:hypothetical protein